MHPVLRSLRFTSLAVALALLALPALAATPVADVDLGYQQISWTPQDGFASLRLTVAGPEGTAQFDFGPDEAPQLDLAAMGATVDGLYTWELRATPYLPESLKATAAARVAGTADGSARTRPKELPPLDSLVQNGSFRVLGGAIVQPEAEEAHGLVIDVAGTGSATAPLERATAADQVFVDDVIVDGSLCVGFDCVNGESFGFDTIRMKENNVRLDFLDTSNSASFPDNDWKIVANDSSNGGAEYLAFEDTSAGRIPFRVQAGARANALVVESSGDIGIGTLNPVVDLHVVTGNTPTLRLEQDGSSGFTPQSWDVAGNETNFFIRDATNGSRLPLRIRPSAPSNSIFVDTDGDIGVGTSSPGTLSNGNQARMHVTTSDSAHGGALIENTSATAALRTMIEMQNNGGIRWRMNDRFEVRFNNNQFQFDNTDSVGNEMVLASNGDLTILGALTTAANTYPDYVFEPGYELMPLDQLASFIEENGHLPNVMSASEVDGGKKINMTRLQIQTLEKVEELTLYTLEQHASINELQAERTRLIEQQEALAAELAVLRAELAQLRN